jgi:OOP family OmpA-OmpF porin
MTVLRSFLPVFLCVILAVGAGCATVEESIEEEVDERVQENVDEGTEETADAIEGGLKNAVKCVVGDTKCIEDAQKEGETVVLTDEDGTVKRDADGDPVTASDRRQGQTTADPSEKQGREPGEANPNYDFEPGERTIFAEDFSDDAVGNFPRSLEFRQGSMEIVEMEGQRLLRVKSEGSVFRVQLPEPLPERFTIEFDFHAEAGLDDMNITPLDESGEAAGANHFHVSGDALGVGTREDDGVSAIKKSDRPQKRVLPVRIMVDGSYAKVYLGKERFANVPNADIARTSTLRFEMYRLYSGTAYIGDLRIAAGGRDLYSALQSEGRVAVQDIRFDTGEATLKPSSTEPLKKVASLLKEHPDLTLLIEGHTDNTGGFEANKALSEERARAVKKALVQDHGIDGSRLKTVGLGSARPVASNETEEGRAQNRRVELVEQ